MDKLALRKVSNGLYMADENGLVRIEDITGCENDYGQIAHHNAKWAVSVDGQLVGFAWALKDIKADGVMAALKCARPEDVADECDKCRWYDGNLCRHPYKGTAGFWALPIELCFDHKSPHRRAARKTK